jgi:hypothetical protein
MENPGPTLKPGDPVLIKKFIAKRLGLYQEAHLVRMIDTRKISLLVRSRKGHDKPYNLAFTVSELEPTC